MASIWKKNPSEKKQPEEKQSEKKEQLEYRDVNQSSVHCASGDHCKMNKTIEPQHTFHKCKDCDGWMCSPLCWVSLEEGVFLCATCGSMKQPAKKSDESTGANTSLRSEKIDSTSGGDVKQFELLKKVCKSKIDCSSCTSESCDNNGNQLWSVTIANKDSSTRTFKTALCRPCSLLDVDKKHMENKERRIEEEKQPSVAVLARVMEETSKKKRGSPGENSPESSCESASELISTCHSKLFSSPRQHAARQFFIMKLFLKLTAKSWM
jgi:hypothetical protein